VNERKPEGKFLRENTHPMAGDHRRVKSHRVPWSTEKRGGGGSGEDRAGVSRQRRKKKVDQTKKLADDEVFP